MKKVIVAHTVPNSVIQALERETEIVRVSNREELLREVQDAQAIHASGGLKVDEELLQAAAELKIVALASVGYNNLDLEAMKRHQVLGSHTPGVLRCV